MDFWRIENNHEANISRDRLRGFLYGAAVGEALATSSSSRSPGHWGHATGVALAAAQALIEAAEEEYSIEDALEGRGRAEYVQRLAKDLDTLVIIKRKIRLGNRCPPCSAAELPLRVAPAAAFLFHRRVEETLLVDFLTAIASATNPHKFAIVPAVELSIIMLAILKEEDRMPDLMNGRDFLLPSGEPLSNLEGCGHKDLSDLSEGERNQDPDADSDSVGHIIYDIIDGSLVYLDKEYALDLLNVKRVVKACEKARITWGEFKNRHPQVFEEVYQRLNDVGLLTLEEWFDKYGDGYALGVEDLTESELEEAKLAYRNHNKDWALERLPLMDERFEVSGWYIDFFDD